MKKSLKVLPYSIFSELVSEPVAYRTLTKLKDQKLLDRNLRCIYIFIEQAALYQNIILR